MKGFDSFKCKLIMDTAECWIDRYEGLFHEPSADSHLGEYLLRKALAAWRANDDAEIDRIRELAKYPDGVSRKHYSHLDVTVGCALRSLLQSGNKVGLDAFLKSTKKYGWDLESAIDTLSKHSITIKERIYADALRTKVGWEWINQEDVVNLIGSVDMDNCSDVMDELADSHSSSGKGMGVKSAIKRLSRHCEDLNGEWLPGEFSVWHLDDITPKNFKIFSKIADSGAVVAIWLLLRAAEIMARAGSVGVIKVEEFLNSPIAKYMLTTRDQRDSVRGTLLDIANGDAVKEIKIVKQCAKAKSKEMNDFANSSYLQLDIMHVLEGFATGDVEVLRKAIERSNEYIKGGSVKKRGQYNTQAICENTSFVKELEVVAGIMRGVLQKNKLIDKYAESKEVRMVNAL